MTIYFVSLISRDDRPLYIQPFSPFESSKADDGTPISDPEADLFTDESKNVNELLKYNFLSHMALDIFESPFATANTTVTAQSSSATSQPNSRNYQLLFVQDGVFVFGLETNTGLKIILGCSRKENDNSSSDGLTPIFRDVHRAYLRLICNPFRNADEVDKEIESPKFDSRIKELVDEWNKTR